MSINVEFPSDEQLYSPSLSRPWIWLLGIGSGVSVEFAGRQMSSIQFLSGRPLLSAGHGVAVAVFAYGLARLWNWNHHRLQLARNNGEAPEASFWRQASQACQDSEERFSADELPGVFKHVRQTWQERQQIQTVWMLTLALFPMIAGLLEGLKRLRLSEEGSFLTGFQELFLPFQIGTIETLVVGCLILLSHMLWLQLFISWEIWSIQNIARQLTPVVNSAMAQPGRTSDNKDDLSREARTGTSPRDIIGPQYSPPRLAEPFVSASLHPPHAERATAHYTGVPDSWAISEENETESFQVSGSNEVTPPKNKPFDDDDSAGPVKVSLKSLEEDR